MRPILPLRQQASETFGSTMALAGVVDTKSQLATPNGLPWRWQCKMIRFVCWFSSGYVISSIKLVQAGFHRFLAESVFYWLKLCDCRLRKFSTRVDYANSQHVLTLQTLNTCRPCKHSTCVDYANSQHMSTVQTLDMGRSCKLSTYVDCANSRHVSTVITLNTSQLCRPSTCVDRLQ